MDKKIKKEIIQEENINGFKVIWTENILNSEERIRLNTDNINKTIEFLKTIPINKL